ncbi:MAG: restriction endonuclease [Clostridia bacterium]|nr:restriction endonuclease [Clostridia bacterium]
MARKKKEETQELKTLTRAQRTDAAKNVIKELLAVKPHKHNELIESAAKIFSARYVGADNENANDVKGRIGSVLDAMQKSSEIMYDGGMYALKARIMMPVVEEKPAKKAEKPVKKTATKAAAAKDEQAEEKPVKKATKKSVKSANETAKTEDEIAEKPAQKTTKKTKQEAVVVEEKAEKLEETAPKKRGRKPKAAQEEVKAEPTVETPAKTEKAVEEKAVEQPKKEQAEEKPIVENPPAVKEKAELVKPALVDMSFLLGGKAKPQEKPAPTPQAVQKEEPKPAEEKPTETKKAPVKAEKFKVQKNSDVVIKIVKPTVRKLPQKPLTADEKLKENFLKRIRALGGDYFEYYSVYLLERYSMKNGRRLEGMKINGGEHDGGIDGEIELTDKFGFRETIYVQSKNWDPEKGKEENWVVGETLLQQFIGACACRQARDGKQHCRGIFITASRFTPEAKKILETMSDKIVGYDGSDLYEAAKECKFGLVYENGNWKLDEKLLSGTKAFFNML